MFPSTGALPATEFLKDSGLSLTPRGEVIVDKVSIGYKIRALGIKNTFIM